MNTDIKIGFIGYGNMAQAMVKGLLLKKALSPQQIFVCAKNWEKLCQNAQKAGVQPCKSPKEAVEQSDIVVIAVKPYLIEEVVSPIKEELKEKLVVSVDVCLTGMKRFWPQRLIISAHFPTRRFLWERASLCARVTIP